MKFPRDSQVRVWTGRDWSTGVARVIDYEAATNTYVVRFSATLVGSVSKKII